MNSKAKTQLSRAQWERITELFEGAMKLPSEERARYIEEATPTDPQLRAEVYFLIQNASAESFMEDLIGARLAVAYDPKRAMEAYAPGKSVGDFEILQLLGAGAFAKVYLARQCSLDREVALKVSANEGREAKTMAHLEHDHIVKVFSETVDSERNLRLLCMQYVAGVGMEKVEAELRRRPPETLSGALFLEVIDQLGPKIASFNPAAMKDREALASATFLEMALWIGLKLADALAYANERGVLHLDVKPSNILLSLYGRPLLTDFNVSLDARAVGKGDIANLGGTFNYMPPEQSALFAAEDKRAALSKIDGRADVYSLGVVVRELATGLPPKSEVPPDALPREVRLTLDRATAPEPEHRFQSAAALAQAFESCLELLGIEKAMPPAGSLIRLAERYPLLSLTLIGGIPQFIASYIGITYNSLRIVSMLTPAQQHWFHTLNITYNPVIYAIGTLVWVMQVIRLQGYLKDPSQWRDKPEAVTRLRKHASALPFWGVAVTTFGWVPGSLVFPLTLQLKAGPLPSGVFGHFLVSFLLSWLIAMAYSFLLHQLIVLRVIYPRCWVGCADLRKTAQHELAEMRLRLRLFYAITGLIPLVAAGILIFVGPDKLDPASYHSFRLLVTFLMGLGVMGVFFALSASNHLAQTLFALTRFK